jgi:CHAT domain
MSTTFSRNKVQGLEKEIANIETDIGTEQKKMRRASNAIQRTRNSTTIRTNQKKIIDAQIEIGKLKDKKAGKIKLLNRTLEQLRKSEKKDNKKIRETDLKYTKAITSELKKQQRLSKDISNQHISVNFESLPEKINVLFLASNPSDQNSLRLDHEIRAIQEKIRASKHRDSINLQSRWAVRPSDLLQEINEVQPHVIHFSGHGSSNHDIVLETAEGNTKLLSKESVIQLMKTMSDSIRLVIFNNCFSSGQAEAVTQHIECAIGMNEAIYDDAAREFAAQFYSAIGFGKSIQDAFNQGKLALDLAGVSGEEIPELYTQDGIDASNIFLVQPNME